VTDLSGQIAVVTGLSGRLGPVWAKALRDAGATVVGVDLNAGENVYAADVTDRAGMEAAREQITSDHGAPTILVNNAGIDQPPDATGKTFAIEDVPLDDFRRTLDVNLTGTFNATQVFGSAMRDAGGGSIVNIGSISALIVNRPQWQPAYNASKAAVHQLTKSLAAEWAPHGVRVNALAPGYIKTEMAPVDDPKFKPRWIDDSAMQRYALPEELGPSIVYLASDASAFMTGSVLVIDGGYTLF